LWLRKTGGGICAYRGASFPIAHDTSLCVCCVRVSVCRHIVSPLKLQFRSVELRNYLGAFGVGSKRTVAPGCFVSTTTTTAAAATTTTRTFPSDAQGWSRAKNIVPKQAAAATTTITIFEGARRGTEDKRRAVAQRAAEIAERRAVFDANDNNSGVKVVHWHPCTRRPELDDGPPSAPGRAWGLNEMPPQTKYPPNTS